MIVLADNDILFKLSACDLFDEFLRAFDVSINDVLIAKRTRFSMLGKKQRARIGHESFARLELFLSQVREVDIEPHPLYYAALTEQTDKNIHSGEAILLAICPRIPGSIIVTGDKNCIVGLHLASADNQMCFELCLELNQRIACFEQIIKKIVDYMGYEIVLPKLIAGRECDAGLRQWLGSTLDANEMAFRQGLTSYLNELIAKTGRLLMNP